MAWRPDGDAACDSCKAIRVGAATKQATIQMMRAAGWRHMCGKTLGGQEFETILCPKCAKDEKRRARKTEEAEQDVLPLDWEEVRIVVGGQGVSSR